MRRSVGFLKVVVMFFILFLVTSSNAYAYIDPGVGNSIFQLIIASTLGLVYVVKVYFKRIVGFLKGAKEKNAEGK